MSTSLAGTAPLLRTLLKHEGRSFAPWILIATALTTSSVLVYPLIFPEQQDRAGLATAVAANPAIGLIFGPAFDLLSVDGFNAWRGLSLGGFLTALGAIFAVTRATRGQEDSGQAELLASGVLGRSGRLLSAIGLAFIGCVLVGVVAGVGAALCGGEWEASMLLGATFTATGWMFAAVAAVAAQLGSDSRTANSFAATVLGVLFILRGFAYAIDAPEWTVWANPLGWMTETRPAIENDWWPLWYALAFTALLLVVAFTLQARRDFGEGAIAPRRGRARGRIRSTWRLALRLNRGPLITWTIAFVALGLVFGYFTASIRDILGSDAAVTQVLAAGATTPEELVSAFLVTILSILGITVCIPGVQLMVKVRTEELEDRVEPILATKVPRSRFYASQVVLAFVATAVYTMITGVLVATIASTADIGVEFGDGLLQAVVTVPAVWTVVGLSVAVIGARPHVSLAAWAGVLISFGLTLLGPTFRLWDWILAISPFWHVPNVTDGDADWWGLVWISLVTGFFLLVGFAGFRHRDLAR